MHITRRTFVAAAGASAFFAAAPAYASSKKGRSNMYGLIGKMTVVPGQRDALISILLEGISGMPGCLSYIVAQDSSDPDAIWVTEVWESQESHQASLSLPSVQQAIARGKPLITGFGERFETTPVGGQGLEAAGKGQ
jgi:quinol monooxygenase YgiN